MFTILLTSLFTEMAATSSRIGQSEEEVAVQCHICMEYEPHLNDPKRVELCSHVLCRDCLLNLSQVSTIDFSCTTCRYLLVDIRTTDLFMHYFLG